MTRTKRAIATAIAIGVIAITLFANKELHAWFIAPDTPLGQASGWCQTKRPSDIAGIKLHQERTASNLPDITGPANR